MTDVNEWNKIDPNVHSSNSYNIFSNVLFKFIRPVERKFFNSNGPSGIKTLTRLRLGFGHSRQHKTRHGFQQPFSILNTFCSGSIVAEATAHCLLRCYLYIANRPPL